jgi:small subunit ribosomal protein S20
MPNTKSAKKAMRSSLRKRDMNLVKKSAIKNSLKDLRKVLSENPANHTEVLSKVYSSLDKAVKTNFIHKNKANRKKSRVAAMVARALAK